MEMFTNKQPQIKESCEVKLLKKCTTRNFKTQVEADQKKKTWKMKKSNKFIAKAKPKYKVPTR